MAGALRKTMVYLGLAEEDPRDDELDSYDDHTADGDDGGRVGAHRAERPERLERADRRGEHRAAVTPISRERPMSRMVPEPLSGDLSRITTIHPRSYNEAKAIGESFRESVPVIMNLTDMDDSDAKRLVDFSAGLVFGLRGSIERVTNKVFLLSPAHIEVTAEQGTTARSAGGGGLFNQS